MTTPVAALLAFGAWTLVVLVGSVGVHRWARSLGAMRAHMNCVENLPVQGAAAFAAPA